MLGGERANRIVYMQDRLIDIKNEALAQILAASNAAELEEIRVEYLGKSKGKLTAIIKKLPELPDSQRAIVGRFANEVKETIENALASQGEALRSYREKNIGETERIDVTLPGILPLEGHLHPLTQTLAEVVRVTRKLGYEVVMGPEIETDHYNFELVNMGKDAPSRDAQASFYLDTRNSKIQPGEILLRTQTSNMQGRVMEKTKPPMRVLVPGKCYRVDAVDASHGFELWQFEGFIVDKNVRMTDMFGTIEYILKELIPETEVKFACTYFAFVEPGAEALIRCTICRGKGCAFCKQQGWSEILGAGMIHPNVLKNAGIDPKVWNGFAFGMGLGRLTVLKYQIDDLRVLTNPDLRILKQF